MKKGKVNPSINADGDGEAIEMKTVMENEIASRVNNERAKPELGEMKRGDYMIHVFVQKAKEMKSLNAGDTVDPMVEVSCLG